MRLLPVLAILLTLALPAIAHADVRSGSVDDPREDTSRTLDSQPDDISFVSAAYDTESGTLTLSARFYGTPSDPDANRSFPPLDFALGKACDESMPLEGSFSGDAFWDTGQPGEGSYVIDGDGSVRLDGFDGTVRTEPTISDDHQTISVTFQHSAFVHQDWRCVAGKLGANAHGTDSFDFYFNGFAPATLTPAIAANSIKGALVTRFGKDFSAAKPRFLGCPQQQFTVIDELPGVACVAEFRSGRTWRYVSATVVADGPRIVPAIGKVRRYVRKWRSCPKQRLRKAKLTGTLASNNGDCGIAGAAEVAAAAKRGTLRSRLTIASATLDQPGFARVWTYRCTVKRNGRTATATCKNSLGDSFRYAFALATSSTVTVSSG
jgi:hypothetical protein